MEQMQRLKRTTHFDASNFGCTNDMRTRGQLKQTIYNMYFKYHPTSGYDHLTPNLGHVYHNFEFCDIL
eukprot:5008524-Amphidinium_carterae.1